MSLDITYTTDLLNIYDILILNTEEIYKSRHI